MTFTCGQQKRALHPDGTDQVEAGEDRAGDGAGGVHRIECSDTRAVPAPPIPAATR